MFSLQIPIIRKVCPNIKFIFNTRHPNASLVSFNQMAKASVLSNILKYDIRYNFSRKKNAKKKIKKKIRQFPELVCIILLLYPTKIQKV